MPNSAFTLSAWVIGGRHRHHRTHDHFGADSDLYVGIDEAIGNWGAGTPVKYVLADLYDRIARLTSYNHQIRVAHLDAVVLAPGGTVEIAAGTFATLAFLDAVVINSLSASFILRAQVGRGGTVTLDAYVKGTGLFYLDAYII